MKNLLIQTLAFVLMAAATTSAGAAKKVEKGICQIKVEATTRSQFVVLKCATASAPGDYVIRNTIKKKDNPKAYSDLARFNGKRFRCDLVPGTSTQSGDYINTSYALKNCR